MVDLAVCRLLAGHFAHPTENEKKKKKKKK